MSTYKAWQVLTGFYISVLFGLFRDKNVNRKVEEEPQAEVVANP